MSALRKSFALSALALAAALVLGALSGDALAYKRTTTATGAGGKTATKDVNATRTDTGYGRSATSTGPSGQTVTKESSGNYDKATNTWTKDKAVTGPGGKTKSWQKSTTVTK